MIGKTFSPRVSSHWSAACTQILSPEQGHSAERFRIRKNIHEVDDLNQTKSETERVGGPGKRGDLKTKKLGGREREAMAQSKAKSIELNGGEDTGGSETEMKYLPKSKKVGGGVIPPKRKLVKKMMYEQIVRFIASLFRGEGGGGVALPHPKTEIIRFDIIGKGDAEKMKIHPFRDDPGAITSGL